VTDSSEALVAKGVMCRPRDDMEPVSCRLLTGEGSGHSKRQRMYSVDRSKNNFVVCLVFVLTFGVIIDRPNEIYL